MGDFGYLFRGFRKDLYYQINLNRNMKELSEKDISGGMNSNYKGSEAEESMLWLRSSKRVSVTRM